MKPIKVSETYSLNSELVLPNDTNNLGNLMGGKLLHWMDIIAAISAMRASQRTVVTVSVDFVEFQAAIPQGSVVLMEARVTRTFTTSMEVRIDVSYENLQTGERTQSNSAYYSFVAVDQSGRPIPVRQVEPETEEERELHRGALQRRELRLLLAGRMKPEETKVLKEMFEIEQK